MIVPDEKEREFLHNIIFAELELGIIKESTKEQILNIINSHKSAGIEGVILACTELPLIIKQSDLDLACLDTAQIHIDAIVERCLQDQVNSL